MPRKTTRPNIVTVVTSIGGLMIMERVNTTVDDSRKLTDILMLFMRAESVGEWCCVEDILR